MAGKRDNNCLGAAIRGEGPHLALRPDQACQLLILILSTEVSALLTGSSSPCDGSLAEFPGDRLDSMNTASR
jgi:hypothetical protein